MKQYNHQRQSFNHPFDATLVVDVPDKAFLEQLFTNHANQSMFLIGMSICSPNDQFVKKTGRELAEQRLTPILVNLIQVTQQGTKHVYTFSSDLTLKGKKYFLYFDVNTVLESNDAHLIFCSIVRNYEK